jgi:beta-N-acetylhexosaminidase
LPAWSPRSYRVARSLAGLVLVLVLGLAGCGGSSRHAQPGPPSTPSTAPATTGPTTTEPACTNAGVLDSWTVARLAAQTIVVPVQETDVAAAEPDVAGGAGGVILFGSSAPPDLARALAALRASAPGGIAPIVMTDEEGGAVQRMANLVGTVPSAREMGATMTPAQIKALALGLGRRMRAAGITMDLAPVLDIDGGSGPNNRDPDGTRSFSADATVASAAGRAFAAGLAAGGVIPVVKHFPGLGGASGNTDVTPAVTQPWRELQGAGLVPFADAVASGIAAIMIANASVPGLTALPASISPAVVSGVLRQRLAYRGLVLTDSLSAAALSNIGYPVPRAAVAALAAGADMVVYSPPPGAPTSSGSRVIATATVAAIVTAVRTGRISRARLTDAVTHILVAKRIDRCPGR